jgi:hypothetical protein
MITPTKTLLFFLCCLLHLNLSAQHAFDRVYAIFQNKCIQCHSSAAQGGLNLQGSSGNTESRKDEVYSNLVRKLNLNPSAESPFRIYPGRPDLSFLYRKINKGFDEYPGMSINPSTEGQHMPPYGNSELTVNELEEIRQWIIYGAPRTGSPYDHTLIDAFYAGEAIQSFPDGAPPAPDPVEGVQIRMGPFYIEPAGEVEFYQKYALELPFDADIDRIDVRFGNFSHHFLLYDFDADPGSRVPDGLRKIALHQDVSLVMAFQNSAILQLPNNTAFFWDKSTYLDLNSHYINYSGGFVYQAEVYINIYFKEQGTAKHQMRTSLIPKLDILIPNNGQTVKFEQTVVQPGFGEIFVWAMAGHTHKYGTSYKVHLRNANGSKGELIYDGACAEGIPGCASPYFDYQHIPFRVFKPLQPINMRNGFIHEATYMNDGPNPVRWGPTSDDEMMLVVLSFVTDTAGIVTSMEMLPHASDKLKIWPNPANGNVQIQMPYLFDQIEITLWDQYGRMVFQTIGYGSGNHFSIELPSNLEGVYFIAAADKSSKKSWVNKLLLVK